MAREFKHVGLTFLIGFAVFFLGNFITSTKGLIEYDADSGETALPMDKVCIAIMVITGIAFSLCMMGILRIWVKTLRKKKQEKAYVLGPTKD
ncbi:MAG: hypothetical protein LBG88_04600 [Christensenellaceae bacterium]|jgi:hypothetical protein|nr:hypothetical protein [Christensenellaceae bacterium]